MELSGKIIVIEDTQTVGTNGFQKREFVLETDDKYPQKVKLEFVKDKVDVLDSYKVGQNATVAFNIRGNEYNGRYYVSLQAWKIDKVGGSSSKTAGAQKSRKSSPAQSVDVDEDVPW